MRPRIACELLLQDAANAFGDAESARNDALNGSDDLGMADRGNASYHTVFPIGPISSSPRSGPLTAVNF